MNYAADEIDRDAHCPAGALDLSRSARYHAPPLQRQWSSLEIEDGMARMSARCILCVFAPLAFLSGCQQIPYFGGPVETKKPDAITVATPADPQPSPSASTV